MADITYPSAAELLQIIAKAQFRPFTKSDWYTFAGCESAEPMIYETDEYSIVQDGHLVNMVYHEDEYGGRLYSFADLG